ncbi:hypothetical protein Ahy_B02g058104 [Arachis hypogaea]|uniref:Uncharacterized protein n=1 Tax=Arachis hypogaea TaxID=3818 RepID=A0A445ADU6_ARAHY|nr:hypothetical protein Ahy_B02g058104 [Arachis hypogaea]
MLYRALCKASHFDCKEVDGPLTLLLTSVWIRLPFLTPIPGGPRLFPLANRRSLDELQKGQEVYGVGLIESNIIPVDIYQHSIVWSATWHKTDRLRRQFGLIQGVPHQERSLDRAHEKVMTGPKNID